MFEKDMGFFMQIKLYKITIKNDILLNGPPGLDISCNNTTNPPEENFPTPMTVTFDNFLPFG